MNFSYLSGDGQTYNNFYKIDCQVQNNIDNNYQEIQDKHHNHNISSISSYMRCFIHRDTESHLFQDNYKNRYISTDTCNMIKNKLNAHLQPINNEYNAIPQFRQHTKLRPIIDQCDMKDKACNDCRNS